MCEIIKLQGIGFCHQDEEGRTCLLTWTWFSWFPWEGGPRDHTAQSPGASQVRGLLLGVAHRRTHPF